jgi:hypothetical protein
VCAMCPRLAVDGLSSLVTVSRAVSRRCARVCVCVCVCVCLRALMWFFSGGRLLHQIQSGSCRWVGAWVGSRLGAWLEGGGGREGWLKLGGWMGVFF